MTCFSQTVRVWDVSSGVCLSSFNIGQLFASTVTAVSSDQVIGGSIVYIFFYRHDHDVQSLAAGVVF